ncbi:MAG TPA: succinate dehydrogenase, cytochrome b556 subunit [Caulobacteraceae bacterium]|nr:succinate dehydrogenase, cytochrome b556 subunit [Caulobacteraceae bacterium]
MAEASPGGRARPLSPHIWIWRWHVTMTASILHRATGVALYGGTLILAGWALALASGAEAYGRYIALLSSIPGRVVIFVLMVSVFFHLANGVRHLAWDMGWGLAPPTADRTAWAAFVFAIVAAAGAWFLVAMPGPLP